MTSLEKDEDRPKASVASREGARAGVGPREQPKK